MAHTILIIEDNPEIRDNLSEMLSLSGYSVIEAAHGKTGLELAFEKLPDLILCDIMMPEADGYEVLKAIKMHPATSRIPFIFITSSVEPSQIHIGLDMGADGYVRKPFDENELYGEINTCLKKTEKKK
ncbi:MAG: response regulator [Flavobacteriales bacterium]